MMPHYHLEFAGALDKRSTFAVLRSLNQIGKAVLGRTILSQSDIRTVLACFPTKQQVDESDDGRMRSSLKNGASNFRMR